MLLIPAKTKDTSADRLGRDPEKTKRGLGCDTVVALFVGKPVDSSSAMNGNSFIIQLIVLVLLFGCSIVNRVLLVQHSSY